MTYPAVPEPSEDVNFSNVADAIETYIKTRDDLDQHRKAYNQYEANAKNYLDRIEMWVKTQADALGVDSLKTSRGTAFRSVKTSYRVGNWDDYITWIKETDNFHCLEKRAAKNAVKEIHDDTGEIPPGLNYHAEVTFDFRRPSK